MINRVPSPRDPFPCWLSTTGQIQPRHTASGDPGFTVVAILKPQYFQRLPQAEDTHSSACVSPRAVCKYHDFFQLKHASQQHLYDAVRFVVGLNSVLVNFQLHKHACRQGAGPHGCGDHSLEPVPGNKRTAAAYCTKLRNTSRI